MQVKVKLPFPGFYETLLGDIAGYLAERDVEYVSCCDLDFIDDRGLLEKVCKTLDANKETFINAYADASYKHDITMAELQPDIIRVYLSELGDFFRREYDVDLKLDENTAVVKSPREYNFSTDSLYCEADLDALSALFNEHFDEVEKYVNDVLKPRSGFIPFYSNDISEWPSITKWGCVQLGLILDALISQDDISDIEETVHDYICGNRSREFDCDIETILKETLDVLDKQ